MIGDLIRNLVPDNVVAVAFQKRQTQLEIGTNGVSTENCIKHSPGAGMSATRPFCCDQYNSMLILL